MGKISSNEVVSTPHTREYCLILKDYVVFLLKPSMHKMDAVGTLLTVLTFV